ncbi:TPA: transglutaminase domain-containing protein [Candidatus Micrarchaeota archaeon]|nr:MAG: hypothetical protein AUJ65_01460 [Candidatus Micrarchaeota archaeon CG1_02_51_15]HII39461.1 transglutaminase domain-containing protein [Candidatus Micrarchaeota archaeon]
MKRLFLLALLLLIAPFAFAVVDVDPKSVGGAVVSVALEWEVDGVIGSSSELALKTYLFYSGERQLFELTSVPAHSSSSDENGNPLLVFPLSPNEGRKIISYSALVRTLQYSDFIPAVNPSAFVAQSKLVRFSQGISSKAVEVGGSGAWNLQKVVALTEWVHDNVDYDGPGYGAMSLDSQSVFESRRGTCDEFSHLLIALLRSQGIPAKFVAGFVYSGEQWVPHAWVEAAIDGEWVSLDPTFNEAIVLDGTHLKFAEGSDQSEIREEVTGKGIGLDLSNATVERRANLSFVSAVPFKELFSLQASGSEEQLGPGSIAVVLVGVYNKGSRPAAAPLSLVVPDGVTILSKKQALLFLEPHERREFSWVVLLPQELEGGYVYTFPLRVDTLGAETQVNVSGRRGADVSATSSLVLSDFSYSLESSEVRFFLKLSNEGSNAFESVRVVVSMGNGEERTADGLFLAPGESQNLAFSFAMPLGSGLFEGNAVVSAGEARIVQPFTFFVRPTPEPTIVPTPVPETPLSEGLFLIAAMAMVLIIVGTIFFLKRRGRRENF